MTMTLEKDGLRDELEDGELRDDQEQSSRGERTVLMMLNEQEEESAAAEEDDTVETDEESEEEETWQRTVLPVGRFDATFGEHDMPQTGEQYLCQVQHERRRLPRVVWVEYPGDGGRDGGGGDHGSEKMAWTKSVVGEDVRLLTATPESVLPSLEFVDKMIEEFEQSRLQWQIMRQGLVGGMDEEDKDRDRDEVGMPSSHDERAWKHRLYGRLRKKMKTSNGRSSEEPAEREERCGRGSEDDDERGETEPDPRLIARMSTRSVVRLLKFHCRWMGENAQSRQQCKWIMALLVAIDDRLTSGEIAVLRELARKCMSLRLDLATASSAEPDRMTMMAGIAGLNGIIAVIARAFGQMDLLSRPLARPEWVESTGRQGESVA